MKIRYYFIISICFFSCKSTEIQYDLYKTNTKVEYYDNGKVRSVGNIEDFFAKDYAFRIGLWSEFYRNGSLKESGHYKFDTYIQCCTSGICDGYYSYKIGEWIYYHENGNVKAKGIYRIGKKHKNTSCESGDKINFGYITEDWKFYNVMGKEIKPTRNDIAEIEKSSVLDELDMSG